MVFELGDHGGTGSSVRGDRLLRDEAVRRVVTDPDRETRRAGVERGEVVADAQPRGIQRYSTIG